MLEGQNSFLNNFSQIPEFDGHEAVVFIQDDSTDLRGFISIHNTNLGPAVGGTRYWRYRDESYALRDALRLSRAMTYKCAIAGLPYGGGKTVLMAPTEQKGKSDEYLKSYARRLQLLSGQFFTGEDVGMEEEDIVVLARYSNSIIGRPDRGGLPSTWAARSVFEAMSVALSERFHSDSYIDRTVAIKGLGNVGMELCRLLISAGATIFATDVNTERIAKLQGVFPMVHIISTEQIHKQKVDIYAPCALSDEFSKETIHELSCSIICGAANNQLASSEDGKRLFERNILYIPDYVANAGGLINVVDELEQDGYNSARVEKRILLLRDTVREIILRSNNEHRATSEIADSIAESRFSLSKRTIEL